MKPSHLFKQATLVLACIVALLPSVFMILTALKSQEEYTFNKVGLPGVPVGEHFRAVLFDSPFFLWMLNSAVLAFGAVVLGTLVSCTGAYAIARMEFRGRDTILAISTS